MRKGDLAFIYYCKCKELGIAGIVRIVTDPAVDGKSSPFLLIIRSLLLFLLLVFFILYHVRSKSPHLFPLPETAFDPIHAYFDPRSTRKNPRWYLVKVEFVYKFTQLFLLRRLKALARRRGPLRHMQMLKNEQVSVSAVRKREWKTIIRATGEEEVVRDRVRTVDAGV